MIEIPIQGMKDGEQHLHLECNAEEVRGAFSEFHGPISVEARIRKVGKRINVELQAQCAALLTCDYSLKEFDENIIAELSINYMIDTELYLRHREEGAEEVYDVHAVHEESKVIDMTSEIIEELAVRLPLKRIAPELRDKNLEDLVDKRFLDDSGEDHMSMPDAWSVLKNLNIENN